jgi:hypothetical protein
LAALDASSRVRSPSSPSWFVRWIVKWSRARVRDHLQRLLVEVAGFSVGGDDVVVCRNTLEEVDVEVAVPSVVRNLEDVQVERPVEDIRRQRGPPRLERRHRRACDS